MGQAEEPPRQRHQEALHRSLTRAPIFSAAAIKRILTAGRLGRVESETRLKFTHDLECQAWELIIDFERGEHLRRAALTGRRREVALNTFFGVIQGCWMAHFDQRLKTSVSRKTGRPSGPLIDFLLACCTELQGAVRRGRAGLPTELRCRVVDHLAVTRSGIRHRVERSAWLNLPS